MAAPLPVEVRETQTSYGHPPVDTRDDYTGFSFRLDAGGGFGGTTRDLSTGQERVRGLAGYVGVDLGSAVSANLILFGHLGGLAFNHFSVDDSANAGSGYVALAGPGLRYHFMPFDWYTGGTLDLAVMAVTDATGEVENSRVGFGLEFEMGKVWSASYGQSPWNVGLGIRLTYARCPASRTIAEPDEPWTVTALNAIFSVGYD